MLECSLKIKEFNKNKPNEFAAVFDSFCPIFRRYKRFGWKKKLEMQKLLFTFFIILSKVEGAREMILYLSPLRRNLKKNIISTFYQQSIQKR